MDFTAFSVNVKAQPQNSTREKEKKNGPENTETSEVSPLWHTLLVAQLP